MQAQNACQVVGERGLAAQERVEVGARQLQQVGGATGADGGGAESVGVEQAHLADELTGPPDAQQALVGGAERLDDFELAVEDDVEAVAIVAFAKKDAMRRNLASPQARGQMLELVAR